MPDRLGTFYGIWPIIDGKPINMQWGEIRSNQAETKAVVRNSIQQLGAGDELNALRARLGDQWGDLDIQGRFRLIYVEATDEFCLQKNDGDDEDPEWVDVFCIRQHDGQFQVVSEGGILSNAGFYNFSRELHIVADSHSLGTDTDEDVTIFNTDRILFDRDSGLKVRLIDCGEHQGSPEVTFTAPFGRSQIFEASGEEWVINHGFGAGPQMVQVMDADDRVIIPDTVDVSDPNIAYFYFHDTVVGSVIIATGGLGAVELRPRDPFYLIVRTDTQDASTRRLRPNADLIFDHKYFYVETHEDLVCGPGSQPGAHPHAFVTILPEIFYLNDLKDVTILQRPTQGHVLMWEDASGAWTNKSVGDGAGGAFYLNDLRDVDVPDPDSGDTIVYNEVTGQWEAEPQVRASFIFTQASPAVEWVIGHGQNSELLIGQAFDTDDRLIFPDVVDYSDPNIAYFYFVAPQAGKAFLIATGATATLGDHDALSGLLDDDHPQYIRVDGTRAFTGNQSHGGNRITSLGAPVASSDAARLADVTITVAQSNDTPSFSGITTVKFEAANFYVTQNPSSPDEVQVNFRGFAAASNTSYRHDQAVPSFEWTINHNLASRTVLAQVYDNRDIMVVPDKIDVSNANVTYFYFSELTSGKALIVGESVLAAAGITVHNQLNGLSADDHPQYVLADGSRDITDNIRVRGSVRAEGFYVDAGALGVGADLGAVWVPFHIETVAVDNYFLDWAGASYVVDDVEAVTEGGDCSFGFYVRARAVCSGRTRSGDPLPGRPIVGMENMHAAFYLVSCGTATGNRVINEGERLVLSVFGNSLATDLHGRIRGRRAG